MLLHHADQGAVQPEVRRPGTPLRQPHGGPAHRGQQHQRRRPGGGHDHRGAPQHAVHRLAGPGRARLCRPGRGALPGRPVPRRGLGRSDHPPARVGAGGGAVRDGEQRRGVRRVAGPGPRRHDGDRGRAAAGPAVAARAGREPAVRPVHRHGARGRPGHRGAPAGQPRAAPGRPAGHLDRAQGPAPPRPGQPPSAPVPGRLPARRDRAARLRRPAAGHHVHLQPGRMRGGRRAVPDRGPAADHARRSRDDPAGRRAPYRRHPARGPDRPRLRRLAGRPAARDRRPPRRDAARVQGGRRGAVRGRPGPGGVRDRDPRPRHQHARPGPWSSRSWTSGTARPTRT